MAFFLPLLAAIAAPVLKAIGVGVVSGAAAFGATKAMEAITKSEPASPTKEDDPPVKMAIGLADTQTTVGEVVAQPDNTLPASVPAPDASAEIATRATLAPRTAFAVPVPREKLAEQVPHTPFAEAESPVAQPSARPAVLAGVPPAMPLTSLPI
ncbi:hypothetical protein GNF76_02640 [Pseudomonas sp. CCM 7893]|uniref:Uncharacterized protein n=1 Tax=Pseudomonas spelaei TaxID=1055469 RepID=A0A6I3VZ38_9PSED|nr:hypothetical protein [Pseudomonas spelaei]MUF03215.1 hypothetical protein [Pseudomonas spelaei]